MNIEELFAGIGVVIDDKVFSSDEHDDRIVTIVKQLEEGKHFPLVKHNSFPSEQELKKMGNVSFLLLDWEIDTRENVLGEDGLFIPMPDTLKENNKKVVINIVKVFLEKNMAPVFIFSNLDTGTIKKELKKEKIDIDKSPVFVESKSNLFEEGKLFDKIEEWVNSVSGVYVAKSWEHAFNKAKNQFFAEMANNTSHWPKSLFKAAEEDTANPGEEITQAISQNILSRMLPIEISQEQIDKDVKIPQKDEILGIMKGQFFLEKHCDMSIVGDFYKFKKDEFYINIRPTCDCVGRDSNSGQIYLLKCDKLSSGQIKPYQGHLMEGDDCAMVGPLYSGKFYRVNFKELSIVNESEYRDKKVGRVMPPIINHIAERFGLYIQRQALPRLPKEILPAPQEQEGN